MFQLTHYPINVIFLAPPPTKLNGKTAFTRPTFIHFNISFNFQELRGMELLKFSRCFWSGKITTEVIHRMRNR